MFISRHFKDVYLQKKDMEHRIKEVIKEKGYTITSLAEKMGIARESLSRMIVSPSYPTLEKLSENLEVPMWQLFASPEEVKGTSLTVKCPKCHTEIPVETSVTVKTN